MKGEEQNMNLLITIKL